MTLAHWAGNLKSAPGRALKIADLFRFTLGEGRRAQNLDQRSDSKAIEDLSRNWGQSALRELGVNLQISGAPILTGPGLIVGNHMSYLDIFALYSMRHVTFVSKAEVRKWPIVGEAAAAAGTLFVQRDSRSSKAQIAEAIQRAILVDKKTVAVFPEGTSSIEGRPWRRGLFHIARDHAISVQALAITYRPARLGAYIDDDGILGHMWKLLQQGPIEMRIEVREPMIIKNLHEDTQIMEDWTKKIVRAELEAQGWDAKAESYV